ncbi:hypothetical protein V6N11_035439 [Hibiscus sabdariffa]|uniref:Myb/SANT-like domain-containing protein n=1 Tax=Hibiscus sabdariffa TaxID=183260 RepID=A0ABR2R0K7_9ROSI
MKNFEKETRKSYTQKQLKNRWDILKKEWKLWKKLKEKDTGLGWNPIKGIVDASEEWWESRLKVVPEAQRFKLPSIDPELEDKLDQMFKGIVATGDKAWAPSSGILPTDFVEHETLEEIEEDNAMDVVHMLSQVRCDENNESPEIQSEPTQNVQQKRKSTEAGPSHLKTRKKKSSQQIGGAAKLSMQIDKLCSTAASMSEETSRLNPITDPFGIPQAVKILEELSEEVPEASKLYFFALKLIANKEKRIVFLSIPQRVMSISGINSSNGDENDDEREINELSQHQQNYQRLFAVTASSVQLYYEKYLLKQPCMDLKQSGLDDADFMEYENNDMANENINPEDVHGDESYDDIGDELNVSSGYEMEIMRDVIACSLMNSS